MSRKRRIIILAILAALVLATVLVWLLLRKPDVTAAPIVDYRDPQLTQEQKQSFLDRIAIQEEVLAKFSSDDKSAEKYQTLLLLGSENLPVGELKKARDYYLAAAMLFPNEPEPHFGAATADRARNNFSEAEKQIQTTLELKPANTDYWRFYLELGEYHLNFTPERMTAYIEDAIAKTNNHPDIYTWAAGHYKRKGDLVKAVTFWNKAKESYPDGAHIYDREINALLEQIRTSK